jgi:hypothetical protein
MPAIQEPSTIESENLETHVALCALRYATLENRLDTIEKKVSTLQEVIEKSHMSMIRVLVGTAGTVVAGVLSTLVIILSKSH